MTINFPLGLIKFFGFFYWIELLYFAFDNNIMSTQLPITNFWVNKKFKTSKIIESKFDDNKDTV